jgi:beta-lactamase regulating signal transducer with metallopeptidase domain
VETVLLLLLANAGCAAVLALAVAAAAGAVRRPAFTSRAWLVVLAKLVTPPLVAVPVGWAVASPGPLVNAPDLPKTPSPLSPWGRGAGGEGENVSQLPQSPFLEAALGPSPQPSPPGGEGEEDAPTPGPDSTAAALGSASRLNVAEPAPEPPAADESLLRFAFVAWLAGAVGWWVLVAVRVVRFRRLLRAAEPADAGTLAVARTVAGRVGLRRLPGVSVVDGTLSPLVWATVGRPRVLLPRRLWAALTADQREAVLAHELAHLARGDHWVRRLEILVLGLYWWFPVAWLAVRQLRRAEEACCDAWVVACAPGRVVAYAEALVAAAAFVSCPGWVPLASGGAARASHLKRRLTMVLQHPTPPRLRWPAALGLVALAVAALPFAPTLADDPPPAAEPLRPAEATEPPPAADPLRPDPPPRPAPAAAASRPAPPAAANRSMPAEEVERINDEVELLEAQRETKVAMVRVAEAAVKQAVVNYNRVEQLRKSGAVPPEEIDKLRGEVENAEAQLAVRRAELKEHEVKIAQARRRAERAAARGRPAPPSPGNLIPSVTMPIRPPAPAPSRPARDSLQARLDDLKEQADRLARETESLRATRREIEDRLKQLDAHERQLQEQRDRLKQLELDLRKALDKKQPPGP